ncbi:MAG: acyltransferase [Anaerorhabdus sp.]|uniref:acyltransferase n=1 Tax=Anaerorhabdus sp. TaxID=1872524 RepID=UPI002FCBE7D7
MSYSIISKYRLQLMGIATLWIALFHSPLWFPVNFFGWFKLIGQGGTDIFVFLSSFGLYYAYKKNSNIKHFYKKRFIRILPFVLPIIFLRCRYLNFNLEDTLLALSTLRFWIKPYDRGLWFASAILVFYLITPLYLKYFDGKEKRMTLFAIGISFLIGFSTFNTDYLVFTSRLPVFFLGFLIGYLSYNDVKISKKMIVLNIMIMMVGFIILHMSFRFGPLLTAWGLYWYPFILIVLPFCFINAFIIEKLKKYNVNWLISFLSGFGSISLEFYLLQELFVKMFSFIRFQPPFDYYQILYSILVIHITYQLAKLYKTVMNKIINLFPIEIN